jgi:pimeloyl-ACP methyl ester carboxylesterase
MAPLWKKKPYVGFGIGVGVLGAFALALRHRERTAHGPIPDEISPAIFATRAASTSHGQIVYHTSGTGHPLVFLHGFFLGASSYEWSKVFPPFAMHHEVIAPDLIGFGESERPDPSVDADAHVESLAEFLREVAPSGPTTLVASGLTSHIALLLAARHPERVSRLVLFLPTTLRDFEKCRAMGLSINSLIPGLNRFVYRHYLARPAAIRTWLRSAFIHPENLSEETVTVLSACAMQYGAEHAIFSFLKNRPKFDRRTRLGDVLAPTHILWPAQALHFDADEAVALRNALPYATMETLPETSAFAPLENPTAVTEAISRCLSPNPLPIN